MVSISISSIGLSHNDFGDDEIAALSPNLLTSSLKDMDFSYNNLNSEFSSATFFSSLPFSTLKNLKVSYTQLEGPGVISLTNFVDNSALTMLISKGNKFEVADWILFFRSVVQSNINYLDLSDCNINDEIIHLLVNELSVSNAHLKVIILQNNLITDIGGIEFITAFSKAGIMHVNIANNFCTAVFAKKCAAQLRMGSNFTALEISGQIGIGSNGLTEIFTALPGSNINQLVANDIIIEDLDAITITQSLVISSITNDLSFLGKDSLSKNQKRVHLSPSSNLVHIGINGLSAQGKWILNRALRHTAINFGVDELITLPEQQFNFSNQNSSLFLPNVSGISKLQSHIENKTETANPNLALIAGFLLLCYLMRLIVTSNYSLSKSSMFNRASYKNSEKYDSKADSNKTSFKI